MSDPRFADHERWTQQNREALARASADLDGLAQRDALVAATAALVQIDDVDWIPFAAAALPSVPKGIMDEIEAFLIGRLDPRPASWLVLGLALAQVAIRGTPSGSRLKAAADRLGRSPSWVHDAFYVACVDEVRRTDEQRQEVWLQELERPVVVVDEPSHPITGRVTVIRKPAEWQLVDVFDLWDSPLAIEAISSHAPTTLLRALDFERWFRAVDRWDDGRLVGAALFSLCQNRVALLRALEFATVAFDAERRWTRRTAAIVLTDCVLRHAQMIHDEVSRATRSIDAGPDDLEALRQLHEAELPAFFTEAWSVIIRRPDGLPIAAALHADLWTRNLDPARDRGVREIARAALAKQLAAGGVRTADLRQLWTERCRLRTAARLGANVAHASGVNVLGSALELVEAGGPADADLLSFWVDRVREPDADWGRLARAGSLNPILDRVLKSVGATEAVLETFCTLYEQLEPARRRGEYGRTYAENDSDFSSGLCLMVILGVLDESLVPETLRLDALDRALGWATRMVLTAAPAFEPTLSVERLFAFAVGLAGRLSSPCLNEALRVTAPDPSLSAWVTASLVKELDRDRVDGLLHPFGLSVESVLDRARQWAQVTGAAADKAAIDELERACA